MSEKETTPLESACANISSNHARMLPAEHWISIFHGKPYIQSEHGFNDYMVNWVRCIQEDAKLVAYAKGYDDGFKDGKNERCAFG